MITQYTVIDWDGYTFFYDVDYNCFEILKNEKIVKWLYKFVMNKFDYTDCYLYNVHWELNTKLADYILEFNK